MNQQDEQVKILKSIYKLILPLVYTLYGFLFSWVIMGAFTLWSNINPSKPPTFEDQVARIEELHKNYLKKTSKKVNKHQELMESLYYHHLREKIKPENYTSRQEYDQARCDEAFKLNREFGREFCRACGLASSFDSRSPLGMDSQNNKRPKG